MAGQKYRTIKTLGAGAMGKVYLAEDAIHGRMVALKVISPSLMENPVVIKRFAREAKVQSMLEHPGVVRIHDAVLDGDRPYIAMEFVQGRDLEAVIEKEAPLDVARVARWMRDLGAGLDKLHELGVVHRDLKPANIMIRDDDSAVVMDLGLAALHNTTQITKTGQVIGTPIYLPPELLDGQESDARSDQWQVGAILFECLTGMRLIPGRTLQEIGAAIAMGRYNPFPKHVFQVPDHVEQTVMRAVAKDPALRFESVTALAESLTLPDHADRARTSEIAAEVIRTATLEVADRPLAAAAVPGGAPAPAMKIVPPEPPRKNLPPWAIALLVVAGLALGMSGGPGPPTDVEWQVVGDTLLVRFAGGPRDVAVAIDGGGPPEVTALEGGRREIRIAGLPPGESLDARLVWGKESGPPTTVEAGEPAIAGAAELVVPGALRFRVRREVEVTGLAGAAPARTTPPHVDVPLEGRDALALRWEEEGVPFALEAPVPELIAAAVDRLRTRLDPVDVEGGVALALREGSRTLGEPRAALEAITPWVPDLLVSRVDPARARWLLATHQRFSWSLAAEGTRAGKILPGLALPPGAPGHRTYAGTGFPEGRGVVLSMEAVNPGEDAVRENSIKLAPTMDGVLGSTGLEKYAEAIHLTWPEGVPAGGLLWFGIHPHRLPGNDVLWVREEGKEDGFDLRLWSPEPAGDFGETSHRGAVGIFLPARLAPAPGTILRLDIRALAGQISKACRIASVEVRWPAG